MPILTSNRAGPEILFALDTKTAVHLNPWESCLRGWFVSTPALFDPHSVLGVIVEGSFVPALYGLPRPDVALHLNDANLVNCGFVVRFRGPKRNPLIKLVVQSPARTVVLAELNVPLAPPTTGAAASIDSYEAWLIFREPELFWPENEVYDRLSALPYRPLVSVLLAASHVDPFFIEQCVQSVVRQKYTHWQLCLCDYSPDGTATEQLQRLTASDDRITLASGPDGAGAAAAQNLVLNRAQGDFIITLGQNDELHPCALLEVVRLLNQRSGCQAIYSDEDTIDTYGSRSSPVFKADMDPDLLLASHYPGRLTALKRETVLGLGGFRSRYEGAHEWDLLIRLLEHAGPGAIQHVAKPLYHRRMTPDPGRIPVRKASAGALVDHAARTGKRVDVEPGLSPDSFRLKQEAPQKASAAVFVLEEDGIFQIKTIRMCFNRGREISLYQVKECAIYPVDSTSPSPLLSLTDISAEVFIFINGPLESLNHLFFEELVAQALRPECGVVTGISVDGERRVLHSGLVYSKGDCLVDPYAGFDFSQVAHLGPMNAVRSVEMISDLFFAIRREYLLAVGGLSAISAGQMLPLVHKLVGNAHRDGLRIIVTPFAVASFQRTRPVVPVDPVRAQTDNGVCLNPNLLAFEDLSQAVRGVF
jgi:hypothetical protein